MQIPENMHIIIPNYGIHRDKNIYGNPDIFDPDRFDSFIKNTEMFMPFGDGPRICIGNVILLSWILVIFFMVSLFTFKFYGFLGAKFAEIVFKITIISLVKKFNVQLCKNCKTKQNDPRGVFLYPKDGIRLKFEKKLQTSNPFIAKISDKTHF